MKSRMFVTMQTLKMLENAKKCKNAAWAVRAPFSAFFRHWPLQNGILNEIFLQKT